MSSLVGYGVSSDSEGEEEQEITPERENQTRPAGGGESGSGSQQDAPARLPPPTLGVCGVGGVFSNPFRERREERLNALQRHVPLTPHARPSHIGGRRVCTAYRRDGRCRFGVGCRFAHDSDLQGAAQADGRAAGEERDGGGEDDRRGRGKRRTNRVGVTDGLVPPKRALKQYALQREKVSHL